MKTTLAGPLNLLYRRPSERTPVAFTITTEAVEQMNGAWLAENGGYGDREVGGWLLADRRWPDQIFAAIDATVDARHETVTMRNLHEIEDRLGEHVLVAGNFHTHPAGSHGVPSDVDMSGSFTHLAHLLDERERDRTLDVIGVPRGDGTLELYGWSTRLRAGIAHRAKTEPARIEVVW